MSVYIEAIYCENNRIQVDLESLLVIYIYKICDTNNLNLYVVNKDAIDEPTFSFDTTQVNFRVCNFNEVPKVATFCVWPVLVLDTSVIAGLCSVARAIIKYSTKEEIKSLLGFKEACLLACSESSIWTKFCEVDVPKTVKNIMLNSHNYTKTDTLEVPVDLSRFEYHMQQPVRMHNIYKIAREKNSDKSIKSTVPVENLNLSHTYGEGLYMTLADTLLYPCFKILFSIFNIDLLENALPYCIAWYRNILHSHLTKFSFEINASKIRFGTSPNVVLADVLKQSLYVSDPSRYNPQNRIYTKQSDVERSLHIITNSHIEIENNIVPYGHDIDFDWDNIPLDANPQGGALPKKRANRKCQQLENLAKAVIKIAGIQNYIIVDFCSGSGHLGILIATLLPNCKIILVENKEKSLARAKERIKNLNLTNVHIAQCNLGYFKAKFNIGVSLHACGVATDLVIQNCIKNKAHFVCCPCCYGGIHNCHHLDYPRSTQFRKLGIKYRAYLSIAHAADQTHDELNVKTKQGFRCMDVVDSDRKFMAESYNYVVHLGKLQPISCTPKNNLLVGLNQG